MFLNMGRKMVWIDFNLFIKDPFSEVTFAAFITAHDINSVVKEPLDSVVGFANGDEPFASNVSSYCIGV